MKKTKAEVVVLFYEGEEPVGLLLENGKREIYRMHRASKEYVAELLDVDRGDRTEA